jgi:predicted aspartyl protease
LKTSGDDGTAAEREPEQVSKVSLGVIDYERYKVGLMRSDIAVDGHPQQAVIDTGASFSVLSATTAKRSSSSCSAR